jgi:NAD(P)H dehydrogenase (quinone)
MYGITGATGRLGQLVLSALLRTLPPDQIAALVRTPSKASDLEARGVAVREADYNRPETLGPALSGVDKLLLIASSDLGRRVPQHQSVVDAAKAAGVKLIFYTSVLRADTSRLAVAEEHRQTEALVKASGVPFVFLRNGWYTENYTFALPAVLKQGAILGSTGDGLISSASRADYAEAAAAVLAAEEDQAGRTYELAGDKAFTMAELICRCPSWGTLRWRPSAFQANRSTDYIFEGHYHYGAQNLIRSSPNCIAIPSWTTS